MISAANNSPDTPLIIASRESRLALWQAEHIKNQLTRLYPARLVTILGMSTRGDRILDQPLAAIGGKGLFIKELENALQQARAHLAVHSMKDIPMELPEGFSLVAVTEREDACDALVSNHYSTLSELPPGAVVGTASLRREALLRARHPHLTIHPLRGNLDTRLRKLDEGQYDAIILAAAGLVRLNLHHRIRARLTLEELLPSPGQGALGIEIYSHSNHAPELQDLLLPLNHYPTALCVHAERAFSRSLGGSCQLPLGAYAQFDGDTIYLRGFIAMRDGSRLLEGEIREPAHDILEADALGRALANELLLHGARKILAASQ